MSDYWCTECGLPADIPPVRPAPEDWQCWACRGPVVSNSQLAYWNNLPFRAHLDEQCRLMKAGESVELAGHPGVRFAPGAAAELLLLEALADDD